MDIDFINNKRGFYIPFFFFKITSIFTGQHNSQHTLSHSRIAWILRAELKCEIVIIEFPKYRLAKQFDLAEVMFAIGIVARIEIPKLLHRRQNLIQLIKLLDALRDHNPAPRQCLTCLIV